ncbi:hypothetical protein KP509_20G048800 [Ceratopteris richardii]|uniref:Resistance to phytophthora 1 n=1 Tax=Ceratopteris richardii TaxID=49495 RepID=A0A8T2SI89_CERRI|nr:hypothetical protein KP509_20G048800 [Ceratopteris richardii]KAH7331746.1 hypothetical protein KP509_20G048800 [Ceratopteris richardii]KAH7331747.1 hypothetical protein KP509_20G048800 [Ceratopteris richardii]
MGGSVALSVSVRSSCSSIAASNASLLPLIQKRNAKGLRMNGLLAIKAQSDTSSEAERSSSSASSPSPLDSTAATQVQDASERFSSAADGPASQSSNKALDKDLTQAVRKTAATFAPRASTKTKNPAVPGTTLYTVFEVQGYLSMAFGGLLSYNLVFPSSEPDIWRLMGMWSVWMFTIPSLRARDCSNKEKDALNYLFLAVPLINVVLPLVWKSFAAVWTADVLAFFAMYAWKLDWLSSDQKMDN